MSRIAHDERVSLADLLEELGPDSPTLCAGWATRHLAAHLVLRERHPSAVGIRVPALAGWTERTLASYASRPYPELVRAVRGGPPPWSPFGLPKVDALVNVSEFFIHHEDVRRAQPGWEPRQLHPKVEDALWRIVRGQSTLMLRSCPTGVRLERPDGTDHVAKAGEPAITLSGPAQELLLYVAGRRPQARVEVSGDPSALETFAAADLSY